MYAKSTHKFCFLLENFLKYCFFGLRQESHILQDIQVTVASIS